MDDGNVNLMHLLFLQMSAICGTITALCGYLHYLHENCPPPIPHAPYRIRSDWFLREVLNKYEVACLEITRM